MDIFNPLVLQSQQHPIFQMLLEDRFAPEREVLVNWAQGFCDRDGKFVQEFQTTFESSMWELYLNAAMRCWNLELDRTHTSPDFIVTSPIQFSIEATIAAPAQGGRPPIGYGISDIPEDFTEFNVQSSIRICNSFTSKVKRYRDYYAGLKYVSSRPFVIAIASFDRPLSHFAGGRSAMAALYGVYMDEAATQHDAQNVTTYNVSAAAKSENVEVPLGLFCDAAFSDVSAVIYSPLATWGKIRALADNPSAKTIYTTFHPKEEGLTPEIRTTPKSEYSEHLLDGMYVFHNPHATFPVPAGVLSHPRLAEFNVTPDGEIIEEIPDDFLLVRILQSF